ncbi:MAG TPA: ABC transporter permease [Acidimicrobiales bacterium]|nr:ABC transporter permease [Acidimicrobiales bacterium]
MTGDQLRRAAAIALANLRRVGGDRRVYFGALVLPMMIMLLVGGVFGAGKKIVVGVVDEDHSALSARAVALLARSDQVSVRTVHDAGAVKRSVRRNLLLAGVVIPAGYGARLLAGGGATVTAVYDVGQPQAEDARAQLSNVLATQGAEIAAARYALATRGVPLATGLGRAEAMTNAAFAADRNSKVQSPSPYAYTAPSNVVLFTFVVALTGSAGFVQSRRLGLTRRMLSTPTSTGAVMLGEAVPLVVAAVVEALLLVVVGWVILRVDWGNPLGVIVLVVLAALAAAGGGMLLGTLARSPEQAGAIGIPAAIGMGMLGGCMWSLDIVGPAMRTVGHLFPTAWAMDGYVALVFRHAGLAAIGWDVAALAVFAVVLLSAGALMLRRTVTPR